MPLPAGYRLGPYEILAPIGAGGMGEVYRARDTRLDRTVAIKIGSEQFSERFEREARAVAALNHPNICTLFDVGPNYLVMEFIDGQTLDRLTPSGGMRLADALKIAVHIAAGLAAAHALGIVHRDLKPGNVMVTGAGVVKLLDFGLAAIDATALPTGQSDATRTVLEGPKTVQGTILGTVSYMSPEQAEGRKLDTRSDIFSFGSLLYEMLTGHRAFQGETTVSTLAAILNKEPKPPASLIAWLPADLDRIVARCLRKDPDRRFQHASDLRVELQELVDAQSSGALSAQPAAPAARRTRTWTPVFVAFALIAGLAGGWFLHRPPPPFQGPTVTRVTYDNGLTCDPALSPDGKLLAYASDRAGNGNLDIWMQPAAGGDPVQLTRDEADEYEPSFSPDGSQLVFRSERDGGGLYLIAALGGEPRLLAREGRSPRFSPDGAHVAYWTGKGGRAEALARQGGRIWVIPAAGGEPRQLADKIRFASTPVWSPDSRSLLFVGLVPNPTQGIGFNYTWYLTALADDKPLPTNATEVLPTANMPALSQWLHSNHIVFAERGTDRANLYRIAINAAAAKLTGKPERITFGGGVENAPTVAANGTTALADLTWNFDLWSLPIDTRGARVNGPPVRLTESLAADIRPSLSADGSKMVYSRVQPGQLSLWSHDFTAGRTARLFSGEIATGALSAWMVQPCCTASAANGDKHSSRFPSPVESASASSINPGARSVGPLPAASFILRPHP